MRTIFPVVLAAVLCQPAVAVAQTACFSPAPGTATPGATIILATDATVQAEFCGSNAGFTSDVYLAAPDSVYIATGHVTATGTIVDIGAYSTGTELIFSIYVRNTGSTFYSGPGSRNPDGQIHAAVLSLGNGEYYVGFEDLFGGGDRDYNDVEFITRVQTLLQDQDGDGVSDSSDNCPDMPNANQLNADADLLGNACDACPLDAANDEDLDGVCGNVDLCPQVSNPSQDNTDGDLEGDACDADDDNDGVFDPADNCALAANPDQTDVDADGFGNVCDSDDDGDGLIDGLDSCLNTPLGSVVDATGCAIVDLCPCNSSWKNHGAYVSCVAEATNEFASAGVIAVSSKGTVIGSAAESSCGQK